MSHQDGFKPEREDGIHRSRGARMRLTLIRVLLLLLPLSLITLIAGMIIGTMDISTTEIGARRAAGTTPAKSSAQPPAPSTTPSDSPAIATTVAGRLDVRLDRAGSVLTMTQTIIMSAPSSSFDLNAPDTSRLRATLPRFAVDVQALTATVDGAAATTSATTAGWHVQAATPGTTLTLVYSLHHGVVRVTPAPRGRLLAVVAGLVPTVVTGSTAAAKATKATSLASTQLTVQDPRVRSVSCITGATSTMCGARTDTSWTAVLDDPSAPLALLQIDLSV